MHYILLILFERWNCFHQMRSNWMELDITSSKVGDYLTADQANNQSWDCRDPTPCTHTIAVFLRCSYDVSISQPSLAHIITSGIIQPSQARSLDERIDYSFIFPLLPLNCKLKAFLQFPTTNNIIPTIRYIATCASIIRNADSILNVPAQKYKRGPSVFAYYSMPLLGTG